MRPAHVGPSIPHVPALDGLRGVTVVGIVVVFGLGVAWVGLDGRAALTYRGGLAVCQLMAVTALAICVAPGRSTLRAAFVCPGGRCRRDPGVAPIREDGVHFTGPGGRRAAAWLLDQIGALVPSDVPGG